MRLDYDSPISNNINDYLEKNEPTDKDSNIIYPGLFKLTTSGYTALKLILNNVINKGFIVKFMPVTYIKCQDKLTGKYILDENGNNKLSRKMAGGFDLYEKGADRFLIHYKKSDDRPIFNCLSVLTGEIHGGFIGIDIDIKGSTPDANEKFKEELNICNITDRDTFVTITPSGGKHYLFKLNDDQKIKLSNFKSAQLKLFDRDIDVLYNAGKFIIAGYIRKKVGDNVQEYKIISRAKPCGLPDHIFQEIIRRIETKKINVSPINKINTVSKINTLNKINTINTDEHVSEFNIDENELNNKEKEIYEYLTCLDINRCNNRDDWLRIGIILKNENAKFELFDKWSQQSNRYGGCEEAWESFNVNIDEKNKLKIGTLIEYAKLDNREKYNIIRDKIRERNLYPDDFPKDLYDKYIESMLLSGNITDNMIGKIFYEKFKGEYIYDGENKIWYTCNKYGIFFKDTDELLSCRKKLTEIIIPIICQCYSVFIKKYKNHKNSKVILSNALNYYNTINKILASVSRKKIIVEQLKELYNIKKFREKMNKNKYIFAFNNGVYDLKNFEFRKASVDELVFETTGYKYITSTDSDRQLIEKTIREIFPQNELYEYFMTILSLRLVKINELEEFYFLIGNASNGKGLITSLIENTFGRFAQTLNSDTFSQTKHGVSAEAASPAIASTYNSNIVFVNELSNKMKITADILKKISGNDKIKTRFLRENFFEFVPGYSLFFVSNFEPTIDGSDNGIKRRLRFIPFNVTFSDNPNINKNEKKINRELKQLFKETKYNCAFIDLLIQYYSKYIKNGKNINIPNIVKYKSDEYLNDNDPIKIFMDSCIEITNNDKHKITSTQLFESFTEFNEGSNKGISFDKLKKRLTLDYGITCKRMTMGNTYVGIREYSKDE